MRFGLDIAQHQLTWSQLVGRARFAEETGLDGVWLFDHFKPLYGDPTGPCFEAWTALAGLAASTQRVRLGVLVTGVTYRHPSVLAAEAVTVDHISGGRLEFGIGAAWHEQEHRELGIPFPPAGERVDRLDEAVASIRLLWTTDDASFAGEHSTLDDATYRPRPVQQPHPPVWIGGSGERRMLPLIGRQADVWHSSGTREQLRRGWAIVAEHAERAGRDPADIRRATNLCLSEPLDDIRRGIDALAESGVDDVILSWPVEGEGRIAEVVRDVLPGVAG